MPSDFASWRSGRWSRFLPQHAGTSEATPYAGDDNSSRVAVTHRVGGAPGCSSSDRGRMPLPPSARALRVALRTCASLPADVEVRADPLDEALQAPVLRHGQELTSWAANDRRALVGAHHLVMLGKPLQTANLPLCQRLGIQKTPPSVMRGSAGAELATPHGPTETARSLQGGEGCERTTNCGGNPDERALNAGVEAKPGMRAKPNAGVPDHIASKQCPRARVPSAGGVAPRGSIDLPPGAQASLPADA